VDRLTSMAIFVAAADDGSLSSAARRFGLSASMAGKHVSSMETDLGVRLMQRSTRKLHLTEVGRAYYERCKRILEEVEEANREAGDAQQSIHGVLRVAVPTTFGAMHLGEVVADYLQEQPGVEVEILLNDHYIDLFAEGVDVAIRIGRLLDSELVARRLAPCHMVVCASPGFLTRHGVPRTVQDLRGLPRLVFSQAVSSGDWTLADPSGQTHTIDGPIRMSANNTQMLLAAARAGAGVTYGPSFVFGQAIAAGELVALLPDHRTTDLTVHAVYPTKRHVSLKLRSFVDHLVASFGGTPPWDRVPLAS
jgi:DNA-binding transcriptional LysR family regulator